MEDYYKFANDEQTTVIRNSITAITIGGAGWLKYQEWVSEGGITKPFMDEEEIFELSLKDKLKDLKDELDKKSPGVVPQSNSKSDTKMVARMVKLVRKETQGRASAKEIEELDQNEILDDFLDDLTDCYDDAERWLEYSGRTLEEIQNYNVEVDPNWPVMEV